MVKEQLARHDKEGEVVDEPPDSEESTDLVILDDK